MFVYFDQRGILKEIITDQPFRVGDSKRDRIYVYWEGDHSPLSGWVKYRLANGSETNETQFFESGKTPLVGMELPQNPARNLRFFSYEHTYVEDGEVHAGYRFYEITVPDEVLGQYVGDGHTPIPAENNMVVARVRFVMDGSGVFSTLGAIAFSVEASIGLLTDMSINATQYNYLVSLMDTKSINQIIYDSKGNVSARFTDSGLSIVGSSLTLDNGTWGFTKVIKRTNDITTNNIGMLLYNFMYDHGGYVDLGSAIFLTSERNVYALSDESIEYVKLSDGEIEVNATVADYLTKNRVDLSTIDNIFVPYTGANKNINIGNHSFTMGSVFTVGSENSVYTQTVPGSISLKNPIGTLGIGISSFTVNGTTIYWPTVSGDPNGKYFALRSDIPSIDDYLSPTSTNAVQNKVVNSTISELSYQLAMVRENLFQTVLSEIDYTEDFATLYAIPDTLSDSDGTHRVLFSETQLREVAGNSIAYNQLLIIPTLTTRTENGITFTNNGDGSVSIQGTATAETTFNLCGILNRSVPFGHKVMITNFATPNGYFLYDAYESNLGNLFNSPNAYIKTKEGSSTTISPRIKIDNGTAIDTAQMVKVMYFDLTLMGLDSVSTVEEAKSELLKRGIDIDQYNPYSEGEIRNTTASGVKVNGYAPYKEPKAISFASTELLGAGEAHDTIEVVEKDKVAGIQRYNLVHVKRVGTVDLGTLSWISYTGISDKYIYQAPLNDMKLNAGLTCSELVQVKAVYNSGDDYSISSHPTLAKIYARTSNYEETETAFKTAMNGVILNYELATPTRTTIAENLTFEEVSATIEQGGSIETIYETLAPNCTTGFVVKKATEVSK